jgi:polyhydroxyalkanoic acid synthase PhaR subunit
MSTGGDRSGGAPDPLKFWRDLYGQNEASWSKVIEQGMGTEAFAQMIGQTLDAYVSFQKALRESLNRYLETMNLPSRDDVGRLGAQLVALEAKIDGVDEKLDDLHDRLKARDGRLEELIRRLHEQDDKIVELNQSLEDSDHKVADLLGRFVAPQTRTPARASTRKREDQS